MLSKILSLAIPLLLAGILFGYNNCSEFKLEGGGGTTLGAPDVEVFFTAYNPAASFGQLVACIQSLELKRQSGEPFVIGVPSTLALNPQGTPFVNVGVPEGVYSEIKVNLSNACSSQKSLTFTNQSGSFESAASLKITFSGLMNVGRSLARLNLSLQPLVDKLNQVALPAEVAVNAESATGTFSYEVFTSIVWTGKGGDANWSTAANWNQNKVPGPSDVALFDASCVSNCSPTIDSGADVGGLQIDLGFAGTITQGAGRDLTVESRFQQASGEFNGSSGNITVRGDFTLAGGNFTTASAGSTLRIGGDIFVNAGFSGPASVIIDGLADQNMTQMVSAFPSGSVTIAKQGSLVPLTDLRFNGAGQDLVVASGNLWMVGRNVTVNDEFRLGGGHVALLGNDKLTAASLDLLQGQVDYLGNVDFVGFPLGNTYGGLNIVNGSWTLTGPLTASLNLQGDAILDTGNFPLTLGGVSMFGTWNHGNSLVTFSGNTIRITSNGHSFYDVSINQPAGGLIYLVDKMSVSHDLLLRGGPGQLLELRSAALGSRMDLDVQGTADFDFLNVIDINGAGLAPLHGGANSTDGGNNSNWVFP